jgi:hypothetical protein
MEKVIKVVFVVAPTIFLIAGVFFIFQAAQFWLVTFSPAKVDGYPLSWNVESPVIATVYLPTAIRPNDSPIAIEVDINRIKGDEPLSIMVQMAEQCDYVRFENSRGEIKFDSQTQKEQTFIGQLIVRNSTPPISCKVVVQTDASGAFGFIEKEIPVDALTGHALSIIQLLIGFAGTFLGFKGVIGLVNSK